MQNKRAYTICPLCVLCYIDFDNICLNLSVGGTFACVATGGHAETAYDGADSKDKKFLHRLLCFSCC